MVAKLKANKKDKWCQIRMSEQELALLDELMAYYEAEDRSSLVRMMMKDYRNRMAKARAKQSK